MNKKKITVIITICIVLAAAATSCTVKKVSDGEKSVSTENIAESVTQASTPIPTEEIDIDLDTVPWGEDEYTKLLPECTFGAVTQITPGDTMCLVLVERIEENDVTAYTDSLVNAGFSCADQNADLYTEGHIYSNADGVSVTVVYSANMMTLMIQK